MTHVYNEIDGHAATWLENLIRAGEIPDGKVDRRSIKDLDGDALRGVTQFHTFAGIGGWPLALRLAGWPPDREVWTGSCPCQPFSAAGNLLAENDDRHLWPHFFRLIQKCRPPVVFGEQVASAAGVRWFAAVRADLEGAGYAVGGADLAAAGVGARHIRQRLYWVADAGVSKYGGGLGLLSPSSLASGPGRDNGRGTAGVGRRVQDEPRPSAVADGVPDRVALIRGYGNAIVPALAAEFIRAFMEVTEGREF